MKLGFFENCFNYSLNQKEKFREKDLNNKKMISAKPDEDGGTSAIGIGESPNINEANYSLYPPML